VTRNQGKEKLPEALMEKPENVIKKRSNNNVQYPTISLKEQVWKTMN